MPQQQSVSASRHTESKGFDPNLHGELITPQIGGDQPAQNLEEDLGGGENSTLDLEPKGRCIRGIRWLITCIALYVTCALYGVDTTVTADVQGAIIQAFGHVEQLAWVGAGFPLGSVCVIFLFGNLYNAFNMKWTFLVSVMVFEAGSALCCGAPNMSTLIAGRVIAGAGGSGIYLGCLNFVAALTTPKERGLYMAMIGFFWGVGAILGPVIGGAFSESFATWRWAFYINLVIGAVSAPAYILALPSVHPMSGVSVTDRALGLDFLGFFLGAGVWASFLMAFTMAGAQWAWNDGRTIGTFVAFGATLTLYILQQYFAVLTTPSRRAFPGHLLKDRTQVLLYIETAAGITTLYVVIYFIPIYFQFVNNDNALMAAVRLLPFVIIAITANLISGHLLSTIKIYMLIYLIAGVFLTIGGALLTAYLQPSTSTGVIYGLTVVIALGSGLAMLTGFAIATLSCKQEDSGAAISMQNVAQLGAQVISLAIAGQIFQSTAVKNLQEALVGQGFSEMDIREAISGAQSTLFQRLDEELRDAAVVAVTKAIQKAIILVPIAGGIMTLAALCMKREKLLGTAVALGA
jgi:MFS family permease